MLKKDLVFITILVVIDQLIKLLVVSYLDTVEVIKNFFNLTYVKNFGISFSMFNNKGLLIILTSVVAMYIIYTLIKQASDDKILKIALLSMLAGAIGNFIDRVFRGFVVDYLAFSFGSYDFAVFNLADVLLVVGCIVVIIYVFIFKKEV